MIKVSAKLLSLVPETHQGGVHIEIVVEVKDNRKMLAAYGRTYNNS